MFAEFVAAVSKTNMIKLPPYNKNFWEQYENKIENCCAAFGPIKFCPS